jgi:menaquinol-cytochrome c reductase iron-sulfur subunit
MADLKENARVDPAASSDSPPVTGAPQGDGKGAGSAPDASRRGALRALVALGSVAYAGAIAVPATQFVIPSGGAGAGKERWIRVAKASDVTAEPRRVQVVGDERDAFTVTKGQILGSIWIFREGEAMRAMSATCPHLGCSIDLNPDKKSFACPCHASRFALLGQPEAGPSPRAMDPLATRVEGGWLEVDFRRFRTGITERQEVGA